MFTLIVGDTSNYLAKYALSLDSHATLIADNISNFTQSTYFTSIGDVSEQVLVDLLDKADKVIYYPPLTWSSTKTQILTEQLLLIANTRNKNVVNLPVYSTDDILQLIPNGHTRKTKNPQLWTMGDSITYPIGVTEKEAYSYKLSKLLDMKYTNLSISASSNVIQASVILKSDLKKGDIVVWGLSTVCRETLVVNNDSSHVTLNDELTHISLSSYLENKKINDILPYDLVDSVQYLFKTLVAVHDVSNICKKLGVTLLLGGLKVEEEYCKYFAKFNNYIQFWNSHLGHKYYANDNSHPGPKTHTWYAEEFYKRYLENI